MREVKEGKKEKRRERVRGCRKGILRGEGGRKKEERKEGGRKKRE